MKKRLKLFLTIEYISFVLFFIYLYKFHKNTTSLQEIIFYILILFILNNISIFININSKVTTSINLPILIPAIVSLGPFWVSIVSMVATILINKIKDNFIWYKFIFNRTMLFIATGSAALVFQISIKYFSYPYFIIPLLLASLTYLIVNNGLISLVILLEGNNKKFSALLHIIESSKSTIVLYILGVALYFINLQLGKGFLVLGVIFIYLTKEVLHVNVQKLNHTTQIIKSFLKVINSKDHYTEGHCQRVAKYTKMLCEEMNLSTSNCNRIVQVAKIHDIGKINVPDEILKSSGQLTNEQYEEVKKHTIHGYELLKDIELLNNGLDILLHHHEHYDGRGYPEGIKGRSIPLGARILAICDAFDVMSNGRSYRPPMPKEEVIAELKRYSGTQFDPQITRKMVKLIQEGKFDESFISDIEQSGQKCDLAIDFN